MQPNLCAFNEVTAITKPHRGEKETPSLRTIIQLNDNLYCHFCMTFNRVFDGDFLNHFFCDLSPH